MTCTRLFTLAPALLAAALGACATFPGAAPEGDEFGGGRMLSEAPFTRERQQVCRAAELPRELPSADALVDSAALTAAVAELWRAGGQPRGHVLLGLRYDTYGLNVRREVLEHRLTPTLADSLQKLVFAHRRSLGTARDEWGLRLRVDVGEQPTVRVGRSEVCSPIPRDREELVLSGAFGAAWGDVRDASPNTADESTVWVRVALDAGGRVTDARLERILSRRGSEQRLLEFVRALAFRPATVDGYPVPATATIPLRVRG